MFIGVKNFLSVQFSMNFKLNFISNSLQIYICISKFCNISIVIEICKISVQFHLVQFKCFSLSSIYFFPVSMHLNCNETISFQLHFIQFSQKLFLVLTLSFLKYQGKSPIYLQLTLLPQSLAVVSCSLHQLQSCSFVVTEPKCLEIKAHCNFPLSKYRKENHQQLQMTPQVRSSQHGIL